MENGFHRFIDNNKIINKNKVRKNICKMKITTTTYVYNLP